MYLLSCYPAGLGAGTTPRPQPSPGPLYGYTYISTEAFCGAGPGALGCSRTGPGKVAAEPSWASMWGVSMRTDLFQLTLFLSLFIAAGLVTMTGIAVAFSFLLNFIPKSEGPESSKSSSVKSSLHIVLYRVGTRHFARVSLTFAVHIFSSFSFLGRNENSHHLSESYHNLPLHTDLACWRVLSQNKRNQGMIKLAKSIQSV